MSLRVSNMRLNQNYQGQVQNIYNKYTSLFEQSDGSKLHRSSDNSVDYSKYLRYQNSVTNNDQYQQNVVTALSWMNNSDTSLTNVTNTLNTFNRKVVDAANSTNNESDLKDIAKELMAGIQEIVQDMNIQLGGRYLFAGQADMVLPFKLSEETVDRGLTKTLDELERNYFTNAQGTGSMTQFVVLDGSDGESYYYNTSDGNIYTKEFVDSGYKTQISNGFNTVQPGDEVAKIDTFVTEVRYFNSNGEINGLGKAWERDIVVDGERVKLTFATVNQYVVEYNGDDKYISMITREGTTRPQSDTVNLTGQDVFGSDIFDCNDEHKTGVAMLNELLTVVAQIDNGNTHWAGSDGTTVANAAVDVVLGAQTKMAARNQSYQATQTMLTTQNEAIMSNISDVSSTNVAELTTLLMEYQNIYSLSLSVGSTILPKTLADYI